MKFLLKRRYDEWCFKPDKWYSLVIESWQEIQLLKKKDRFKPASKL